MNLEQALYSYFNNENEPLALDDLAKVLDYRNRCIREALEGIPTDRDTTSSVGEALQESFLGLLHTAS